MTPLNNSVFTLQIYSYSFCLPGDWARRSRKIIHEKEKTRNMHNRNTLPKVIRQFSSEKINNSSVFEKNKVCTTLKRIARAQNYNHLKLNVKPQWIPRCLTCSANQRICLAIKQICNFVGAALKLHTKKSIFPTIQSVVIVYL